MTLAIHIGYHKTATTWLQRQVFIPEMGFVPLLDHSEVDQLFLQPHDLIFDPKQAKNIIDERCKPISDDLCAMVSSETLSGHPFYGGRQSASIAKRIKQVSPDAHIIICVRSQVTMLPSVYMQYLQRGGTLDHQAFFAGPNGFSYPGFEREHFEYHRLISLYQGLFKNVHVLTHEQILQDPIGTINDLRSKLKINTQALGDPQTGRESASLPQALSPLLRAINKVRISTLNPAPAIALSREPGWMYRAATAAAKLPSLRSRLTGQPVSDYVAQHLAASFTESNRHLDQITQYSLDLSAYP